MAAVSPRRRLRRLIAPLLLAAAVPALAAGGGDAFGRGVAALNAGKPRVARVEFMNAIEAAPGDPQPHLMQARTFLVLEDGVAAEAEVARARASGAPDKDVRHMLAEALLLQGEPEQALAATEGASRFPGAALRMRGRAHQALGRNADAASAFDEALRVAPRDHRIWVDVARLRLQTGDQAGAIAAADRALALNGRYVPALMLRGALVRTQYGLKAALPWFARARDVDPEHAPAWIEEAATLGDLGRTRAMLAATRHALTLRPDDPQARYLQAVLAARARNWGLARGLFERMIGPVAATPGALLLGAAIDLEGGNAERAIVRLGALVGAQPGNLAARRLLGLAHLRAGDGASAVGALRPLEDEGVADPHALTLLAAAYARAGDRATAARALVRAAAPGGASEMLPVDLAGTLGTQAFAGARDVRWQLRHGTVWTGVARARSLAAESPGAPDAHLILGDALMRAGDPERAAAAYRNAANIAFIEPVALRFMEALQAAGRHEDARNALALFVDQNPQSVAAQRLLANTRLAARDWTGASAAYDRIRARTGDHDAVLLNNSAWARHESGDVRGALADAARAYELAPGNVATADARGWMLLKTARDRPAALALLGRSWLER